MSGKGDKRRPGNEKKFRDNWEEIFSDENVEKTLGTIKRKVTHAEGKLLSSTGEFQSLCGAIVYNHPDKRIVAAGEQSCKRCTKILSSNKRSKPGK